MVTYPYAYMTYIVSPLAGLGGGISWRPPAYSLFSSLFCLGGMVACVAVEGLVCNKCRIARTTPFVNYTVIQVFYCLVIICC